MDLGIVVSVKKYFQEMGKKSIYIGMNCRGIYVM